MNLFHCSKHGKVEGVFCKECRAEKYVEKVKAGLIEPRELINLERPVDDLLPLQIRFRAFLERTYRKTEDRAYSWQQRSRVVRIVPTTYLGEKS